MVTRSKINGYKMSEIKKVICILVQFLPKEGKLKKSTYLK